MLFHLLLNLESTTFPLGNNLPSFCRKENLKKLKANKTVKLICTSKLRIKDPGINDKDAKTEEIGNVQKAGFSYRSADVSETHFRIIVTPILRPFSLACRQIPQSLISVTNIPNFEQI